MTGTPAAIFAPPVQHAIRTHAYDALRRAIVSGALQPGQRVNEAEIARQMGISRAPLREAIRQLEQDGLLVSVPRRGTAVAALSAAEVEEVYTLRADLEARAVRRALGRASPADLAELDGLADEMDAAAARGDATAMLEADADFHRRLVALAGWAQLRRVWESLHPQTLTLNTVRVLTDWSLADHARRHRPLLEALRRGDADAAAAAIHEHIVGVGAEVMRRVASQERS